MVLGSGGVSHTVQQVLKDRRASGYMVSRTGQLRLSSSHRDAEIIINATPVGMYPDNGRSLIDFRIPQLLRAVDVIYNRTRPGSS